MTVRDALTLEQLDRDGALLEAVAALHGDTRAEFLRKAAVGGGAMVAALAAPPASMAAERLSDVDILNFGLRFERLQATFYTEADSMGTIARMSPPKQRWARVLGAHERAHVRIIKKILGDKADRRPFFDFHGVTETDAGFHAHCRRHGGPHGRPARGSHAGRTRSPARSGPVRSAHQGGAPRRMGTQYRPHDTRGTRVR